MAWNRPTCIFWWNGLPYFFELDGNTTANHPFYLASGGVGGDDYTFEYLEGVENSRTTDGLLIFRLGFTGPSELIYACGAHAGMGGKLIIPSDERPRSSLTFAAVDQGGNFITDGNWSSANGDGIPVFSGQSLLQDQNITLSYQPPTGYVLMGWEGDLPADSNTSGSSVSFDMSQDRTVQVQQYWPHMRPRLSNWLIDLIWILPSYPRMNLDR